MPIRDFFTISFDDACGLLERLNDTSSVAEIFEVIEFTNDIDPVHYRLRWEDADHIIENVWTFPIKREGVKGWLAENARDSIILEWVVVSFWTAKAQSRFVAAHMEALSRPVPDAEASPFGP